MAVMDKAKAIVALFVNTYKKWNDDGATRIAAALAFYTMLSLAPLLVVLTGLIGRLLGPLVQDITLPRQIQDLVGPEVTNFIQGILESFSQPSSVTLATVISIGAALWGASTVFNHLYRTLNLVWGIKPEPGRAGIVATVRGRLLSFAVVVVAGILFIVYMFINALLPVVFGIFDRFLPEFLPSLNRLQIGQYFVTLVVLTLLFALFYKYLPDARIAWRDVWIGAAVTSTLFGIGSLALSIYFRFSTLSSIYGAAGTIMVVLLWFYYSAQIFLFGAEFTAVYAKTYGSQIVPADYAMLRGKEAEQTQAEDSDAEQAGRGRLEDAEQPRPQAS